MHRYATLFICLFHSCLLHASGRITLLDLLDDTVVFSTDASKSNLPACANAQQADSWAFSLSSDAGRAMYSLLMAALAKDMQVIVESAGDCAVLSGVERPRRLQVLPPAQQPDTAEPEPQELPTFASVTTFQTVAYGAFTHNGCERENVANTHYMKPSCTCQSSTLVIISVDEDDRPKTFECVIEVNTPIIVEDE